LGIRGWDLYISSEVAAHEGHRRDSFLKVVVKGRRSRRRIATSKAEFEKVFESSEAMTLKVVESERASSAEANVWALG
jgi:hypothetical protein